MSGISGANGRPRHGALRLAWPEISAEYQFLGRK
jgi:hypothetical protein